MNHNAELFARYEAIAAVSRRMLTAARGGFWPDVTGLQQEYRSLVDSLKPLEAGVLLDSGERERKYQLLRQILAADAEIRDLANPTLAQLAAMFTRAPVARATTALA